MVISSKNECCYTYDTICTTFVRQLNPLWHEDVGLWHSGVGLPLDVCRTEIGQGNIVRVEVNFTQP